MILKNYYRMLKLALGVSCVHRRLYNSSHMDNSYDTTWRAKFSSKRYIPMYWNRADEEDTPLIVNEINVQRNIKMLPTKKCQIM